MTNVGENIKKMRKKLKITQDELSEKLNVTRQAVSNWENGKTEPDIETLTKMAQIFDISIDELVDGIPKGIKELRGKKSHLYIGIAFTLFYILSSLTMILIEKMFHDYVTFTYDFFYSAFYVFVWKPLTVISSGIGIPALISYISGLYIENKKLRIACIMCIATCGLESFCTGWGATYLVEARALSTDLGAKLIIAFYLGMTLGRLLAGFVADKIKSWNEI